jgi:cytochrome c2
MLLARLFGTTLGIAASLYLAAPAHAQGAAAGEAVFKKQCSMCHSVVPGKKGIGPNLFGLVGRAAGTVPDFRYSEANRTSGLTWDAATLDRYIKAPKDVVPKTTMPYPGLADDRQRADLIAYLGTLK